MLKSTHFTVTCVYPIAYDYNEPTSFFIYTYTAPTDFLPFYTYVSVLVDDAD